MKFSAGYQADAAWIDALVARRDALCDVYFAFGAMPSGRKAVTGTTGVSPVDISPVDNWNHLPTTTTHRRSEML